MRALLVLFARQALLYGLARCHVAGEAGSVAAHVQCMPAAIEIDHCTQDRAGFGGEFCQLSEYRIGFGCLIVLVLDGVEPLLRESRHAAVFALGRVGEFVQARFGLHALGRGLAGLRMAGSQCEPDQQILIGDTNDGAAAALGIMRFVQGVAQRGCNCLAYG